MSIPYPHISHPIQRRSRGSTNFTGAASVSSANTPSVSCNILRWSIFPHMHKEDQLHTGCLEARNWINIACALVSRFATRHFSQRLFSSDSREPTDKGGDGVLHRDHRSRRSFGVTRGNAGGMLRSVHLGLLISRWNHAYQQDLGCPRG